MKLLLSITIFTLLAFSTTFSRKLRDVEISPFIVNGTDTLIEEMPFIVSLQNEYNETYWSHYCGGSIINEFWTLTAAHCVHGNVPEGNRVQYGATVISSTTEGTNNAYFERIIWHENYDPKTLLHDIALIKTKTAMDVGLLGFIAKLSPPNGYYSTGMSAVVAGYGRMGDNLPISTTLQKVVYQIYSYENCAALHDQFEVFPTNICGGLEGGYQGQCRGDSGGPLVVDGVQVGIVSWSIKPCTVPPYPGVFTAVAHYINWIRENTMMSAKLGMFVKF